MFLMGALPNIKIEFFLLTYATISKILMYMQSGTFLPHHMAKQLQMVLLVL